VSEHLIVFRWPAINHLPGWRGIRLQPYGRTARLSTVERRVQNPFTERFVLAQSTPDTKTEIAGVCVDEARADATIAPVPVNECQTHFAHLPALMYEFVKESSLNNLGGVESVKVNFHVRSPACLLAKHSPSRTNEQYDILTRLQHPGLSLRGSRPILSLTASRSRCLQPK
jgi:hypothetical protein